MRLGLNVPGIFLKEIVDIWSILNLVTCRQLSRQPSWTYNLLTKALKVNRRQCPDQPRLAGGQLALWRHSTPFSATVVYLSVSNSNAIAVDKQKTREVPSCQHFRSSVENGEWLRNVVRRFNLGLFWSVIVKAVYANENYFSCTAGVSTMFSAKAVSMFRGFPVKLSMIYPSIFTISNFYEYLADIIPTASNNFTFLQWPVHK